MNTIMKWFKKKQQYTIAIIGWFCLSIVFCPSIHALALSSKQAFYDTISKDRAILNTLLQELESLTKQGNQDAISDKKIEIFLIMENILKQKRQLFQAQLNELQSQYELLKHDGGDMHQLDVVHSEMMPFESIIEEISLTIKKYIVRRKQIFNAKIKRHTKVVSKAEIDAQKKELVGLLLPLIAKRDNLIDSGAGPSEIYAVKREIGLLTTDYTILGKEIGITEEESLNELSDLFIDIDESFDEESERRKYDPDMYKYRRQARVIDRGIKYKRLSEL